MLMGGFPYVIEAVGAPQSVTEALRAVAHRGTVLLLGAAGISEVDLTPIWYKEAALVGSIDHTVDAALGARASPAAPTATRWTEPSTCWPPASSPTRWWSPTSSPSRGTARRSRRPSTATRPRPSRWSSGPRHAPPRHRRPRHAPPRGTHRPKAPAAAPSAASGLLATAQLIEVAACCEGGRSRGLSVRWAVALTALGLLLLVSCPPGAGAAPVTGAPASTPARPRRARAGPRTHIAAAST